MRNASGPTGGPGPFGHCTNVQHTGKQENNHSSIPQALLSLRTNFPALSPSLGPKETAVLANKGSLGCSGAARPPFISASASKPKPPRRTHSAAGGATQTRALLGLSQAPCVLSGFGTFLLCLASVKSGRRSSFINPATLWPTRTNAWAMRRLGLGCGLLFVHSCLHSKKRIEQLLYVQPCANHATVTLSPLMTPEPSS